VPFSHQDSKIVTQRWWLTVYKYFLCGCLRVILNADLLELGPILEVLIFHDWEVRELSSGMAWAHFSDSNVHLAGWNLLVSPWAIYELCIWVHHELCWCISEYVDCCKYVYFKYVYFLLGERNSPVRAQSTCSISFSLLILHNLSPLAFCVFEGNECFIFNIHKYNTIFPCLLQEN